MRWAVLVAVAACSVDAPPNVHPLPLPDIAYSLRVGEQPPMRASDRPTIYIDGVATTAFEQTYPPDVATYEHHVELRYQNQVLSALDVLNHPTDCDYAGRPARLIELYASVAEYDSGELRDAGYTGRGDGLGCVADASGAPDCPCSTTERCTAVITRADPLFTKMACAPIGPKASGDACTLISDPAGAYDDCGEGLLCYQGACRATCIGDTCLAGTCTFPTNYPPQTGVCL